MLHSVFHHTHLVWTLLKKRRYHLCIQTISCRWYRLLLNGDTITAYSISIIVIRMCDFGFSDPFLLFFRSIVFHIVTWNSESCCRQFELSPIKAFCQNMIFAFRAVVPKEFAKPTFRFYSTCLRTLVICFDCAFRHVFVQLLLRTLRHFARKPACIDNYKPTSHTHLEYDKA